MTVILGVLIFNVDELRTGDFSIFLTPSKFCLSVVASGRFHKCGEFVVLVAWEPVAYAGNS